MTDESDFIDTSDWPETEDYRAWVEWRTNKLRSGDPYWQPVADRLAERGLDPHSILLADLWPEDVAMEVVVVVTPSGDVLELEFSWLHTSRDEGTFTECKDLTSSWRIDAHPDAAVAAALQIIGEQSGRELNAARRTDPDKLRSHVAHCTQQLRPDNVFWKPFADRLGERGIDLTNAALGHIYSEREGRAVRFIVTGDGTVFLYNFQISYPGRSEFTAWKDVTNEPTLDVHERDLIDIVLEIARSS